MNKYLLVSVLSALAFPAYADVESFVNAAKGSDISQVQSFLQSGENINAKNALGNTALHYAAATGNSDMVKFLLENGADPTIANDKGWTPLAIAEKKNLGEIVNMFQSAQNNKDLSDLVEKASATAQKAEEKAVKAKDAVVTETNKVKENIAEAKEAADAKVAEVKENITEAKEAADAKVAEVKENVTEAKEAADAKVAEVKENVTEAKQEAVKKIENATNTAINSVDETKDNIKTEVANIVEKTKETETNVKEAIVVPEVAQIATKTETKSEIKAEPKAEAKIAPKPAPRRVVNPVAAKPAPKFLASNINKAIYAGDEEIVYCLYYLGLQTDQHNLTLASEFFAGTTTIGKARFDRIADLALNYYDNASAEEMQNMANTCAKIITPRNRDKQNQIIRAMNKAIGY